MEHLIALMYHYPHEYELWQKGLISDYEASTGIFISAESPESALAWGAVVAEKLLNFVNNSDSLTLENFQHTCWIIDSPSSSAWSHCLDFFQHIKVGEHPEFDRMTTEAYDQWQAKNL